MKAGIGFMERQTQGRTLEDCIQRAMQLGKPSAPKNLLAYDLMLNLPTDDIDIETERRKAREELEQEGISGEKRKYIEAKLYVLDLKDKYDKKDK